MCLDTQKYLSLSTFWTCVGIGAYFVNNIKQHKVIYVAFLSGLVFLDFQKYSKCAYNPIIIDQFT